MACPLMKRCSTELLSSLRDSDGEVNATAIPSAKALGYSQNRVLTPLRVLVDRRKKFAFEGELSSDSARRMFAVFKRWPIAAGLFVVHAAFVLLIYVQWATDSGVERGMIWMTVFLIDLPSSYLYLQRQDSMWLYAVSAIFIGGLQWALVGALFDLLRRFVRRKQGK